MKIARYSRLRTFFASFSVWTRRIRKMLLENSLFGLDESSLCSIIVRKNSHVRAKWHHQRHQLSADKFTEIAALWNGHSVRLCEAIFFAANANELIGIMTKMLIKKRYADSLIDQFSHYRAAAVYAMHHKINIVVHFSASASFFRKKRFHVGI